MFQTSNLYQTILGWAMSPNVFSSILGWLLLAGIVEEIIKALVLLVILKMSKERLSPETMLFYGLMSGLGFGIYEGVTYQMGQNNSLETPLAYILNVMRLTSLPFLHAVWSGICGYLLAFAWYSSKHSRGLYVAAIGIPALLHAFHNGTSLIIPPLGLLVDFIAVVALLVYRSRAKELERATS
ncbi:MAG: PrsW family intramembrane metalloprotease [Blastochloris sp.]|nr:PrsW family intramembrane metalloprotease [Blastochloris sp.]